MLYTHFSEELLGLKEVIVKNVKQMPEITEIHLEMRAGHISVRVVGRKATMFTTTENSR